MNQQDTYRRFCEGKRDLPIFMQPFWLDLMCVHGQWDAVFSYEEDGRIRGTWAYHHGTKLGMRWIRLPLLTPYTALWIDLPEELSPREELLRRHEIMFDLEQQLPRTSLFELKLAWSAGDWLPLYWKGYQQETRYTFRFDKVNTEDIFNAASKSFRRNLRAAERYYEVKEGTAEDLFTLMSNVFEMREAQVSVSLPLLKSTVAELQRRGLGTVTAAVHEDTVEAIALTVWDTQSAYALIGGRHMKDSRDGMHLLLWESIREAERRGLAFDFEGSMMQGVNRFFQNFGATLTPYHYIYRYRGLAKFKYLR